LAVIQITVWMQGLFSGFVTVSVGRYGKWYQPTTARRCSARHALAGNAIATMTSLRDRPLMEVCTVPVLLVYYSNMLILVSMYRTMHRRQLWGLSLRGNDPLVLPGVYCREILRCWIFSLLYGKIHGNDGFRLNRLQWDHCETAYR